MEPFLSDPDVTLYCGEALKTLESLPAESVDCIVTSPPYFGLRDYGVEGQLGLERSVEHYVQRLVDILAEARRVLSTRGTLWLNIGDTYAAKRSYQVPDSKHLSMRENRGSMDVPDGLRAKDLIGVPWRVAFALQQDGWRLRSDIIWNKTNALPESVTDRPTKGHEYVFLFARSHSYFFDQDAVREPAAWERWGDQTVPKYEGTDSGSGWMKPRSKSDLERFKRSGNSQRKHGEDVGAPGGTDGDLGRGIPWEDDGKGRNIRTVWTFPTQPYADAHFATFPEELPRRCILAGCPEGGVVLDPFAGSGTTAVVARKNGRRSVLIEINPSYCEMISDRLAQQSLLTS